MIVGSDGVDSGVAVDAFLAGLMKRDPHGVPGDASLADFVKSNPRGVEGW